MIHVVALLLSTGHVAAYQCADEGCVADDSAPLLQVSHNMTLNSEDEIDDVAEDSDAEELTSTDSVADTNNAPTGYIYAFLPEACGSQRRRMSYGMWNPRQVSGGWLTLDKKIITKKIRTDGLTKKADEAGLIKFCLNSAYYKKNSACYHEVRLAGENMYWMSCAQFGQGIRRRFCRKRGNSCSDAKTFNYWQEYTGSCSPSDSNTAQACLLRCSWVSHRTKSKLCDNGMYELTDAQETECGSNAAHNGLKGCYRVRYGRGRIQAQTR